MTAIINPNSAEIRNIMNMDIPRGKYRRGFIGENGDLYLFLEDLTHMELANFSSDLHGFYKGSKYDLPMPIAYRGNNIVLAESIPRPKDIFDENTLFESYYDCEKKNPRFKFHYFKVWDSEAKRLGF